jgi:hypothetical protein
MSCPLCCDRIFFSKEEPQVQVGCPSCGGKIIPITMTEEEYIRQLLDNQKESCRQMKLPYDSK